MASLSYINMGSNILLDSMWKYIYKIIACVLGVYEVQECMEFRPII